MSDRAKVESRGPLPRGGGGRPSAGARWVRSALLVLLAGAVVLTSRPAAATGVTTARVPGGGLQPQAAVDAAGITHLVYLKGDPAACDVYYARSVDGATTWSPAARVNSVPGSAVALGTVRGAHLAVGPDGRPHVAWMGSGTASPRGPGNATPMLYARLADDGKSFEPERNVVTSKVGLDGGGSVAVDARNRVYVGWHAPPAKGGDEATRAVYVATSDDGGRTFAPERLFSPGPTGACGCCGMRMMAHGDALYALYRSATADVHRDLYLVAQPRPDAEPTGRKVAEVTVGTCVMSTASMARGPGGVVAAWETNRQIQWATINPTTGEVDPADVHTLPGTANGGRKHPSVAVNAAGQTMVAWAEDTGWQKGGSVAWQVFDAGAKPVAEGGGRAQGLAAWSLPAAVLRPDGTFVIIY